jgi:Ca2+-binding EF-hand superfamily protein
MAAPLAGALRLQKINHWFDAFDVGGDGVLERADFAVLADRYAAVCGVPAGGPAHQRMLATLLGIWDGHFPGDAGLTARIPKVDWVEAVLQALDKDPEAYRQQLRLIADAFFDACDTDGDGVLSREAHTPLLIATTGCSPDGANQAFDMMDLDGDGALSRADVCQGFEEFVMSEDPHAQGNWFFGPLH